MKSKPCTECNTENHIINFCQKIAEYHECNRKRVLSPFSVNKDKNMNQQMIFLKEKDWLIKKPQKQKDLFRVSEN